MDFYKIWPRISLIAAIIFAAVIVFFIPINSALFWVWVNVPLQLIHQFEEHGKGRFKKFANKELFKSKTLSDKQLFRVDAPISWILFPILAITSFIDVASGLLLPYVAAVDSITHIALSAFKRKYTPGLIVSIIQFPVAIISIIMLELKANLSPMSRITAIIALIILFGVIFLKIWQLNKKALHK